MGRTFSRTFLYKDTGDANRVKFLTGKTNVKLQPDGSVYPTNAIALTETTPGSSAVYKNDNVNDGNYELYVDDVLRAEFGKFWVGDDDISTYAKKSGGNDFSGNQNIAGSIDMTGNIDVDGYISTLGIILAVGNIFSGGYVNAYEFFMNVSGSPYLTNTPTGSNSLIWKSYLEARLAGLVLTPYQESSNRRRCIPNGTVETNKVYPTLKTAAASFSSPSINNQCYVDIPGTGTISRYIAALVGAFRDYVHWVGVGRHINMVISDGQTNSKICTFENLTLFFGANDFAAAREYSNKTFINCTIYVYKDITFNNCVLINCRIISASTYIVYLKGTTECEITGFNNEYDKTQLTTGYVVGAYGITQTTMPTDPSTVNVNEE